jgi:hypothetical protein
MTFARTNIFYRNQKPVRSACDIRFHVIASRLELRHGKKHCYGLTTLDGAPQTVLCRMRGRPHLVTYLVRTYQILQKHICVIGARWILRIKSDVF